jgi:hypothetical protein
LPRELSHPPSLVVAAHFAAHVHQLRGDVALMRQRADEAMALADEYGLAVWMALARLHHTPGDSAGAADAIDELRRGVTAYEVTGGRLWRAYALRCTINSPRARDAGPAVGESVDRRVEWSVSPLSSPSSCQFKVVSRSLP